MCSFRRSPEGSVIFNLHANHTLFFHKSKAAVLLKKILKICKYSAEVLKKALESYENRNFYEKFTNFTKNEKIFSRSLRVQNREK